MINSAHNTGSRTCNVLLIEDNDEVAALIRVYLRDPKINLTVSASGKEGIDAFKRSSFDIVLMDIQMPGVNGFEATRAMRHWETYHEREPTPIAALTGYESAGAVTEVVDSGCTQYLRKPISRNVLLQTVA